MSNTPATITSTITNHHDGGPATLTIDTIVCNRPDCREQGYVEINSIAWECPSCRDQIYTSEVL